MAISGLEFRCKKDILPNPVIVALPSGNRTIIDLEVKEKSINGIFAIVINIKPNNNCDINQAINLDIANTKKGALFFLVLNLNT